ncbi:hypothetical protein EJ04DRAFT_442275 [Polyplosphaeria fusca]|uniref:Uncharacterized protein n=1 Tax=Polyplosphaeria fusca TaxID=682080 RepID=A0A9P4QVD9_9PLEO|nr:hypothetical protein EJ04DRAFT_442275 [Polyplosphaeria fusca]
MKLVKLSLLALLSPALSHAASSAALKDFLLVTTDQKESTTNSADLKAVSATSLFDPYYQPNVLLRLIDPGYGSLPNFTLTGGQLQTLNPLPHGGDYVLYNSTTVAEGKELQFFAEVEPRGNLDLDQGYLLSVDGDSEGWTLCPGSLSARVVAWKGTAEGCKKTYLQAVQKAPY